jgi:hypothetical protein
MCLLAQEANWRSGLPQVTGKAPRQRHHLHVKIGGQQLHDKISEDVVARPDHDSSEPFRDEPKVDRVEERLAGAIATRPYEQLTASQGEADVEAHTRVASDANLVDWSDIDRPPITRQELRGAALVQSRPVLSTVKVPDVDQMQGAGVRVEHVVLQTVR